MLMEPIVDTELYVAAEAKLLRRSDRFVEGALGLRLRGSLRRAGERAPVVDGIGMAALETEPVPVPVATGVVFVLEDAAGLDSPSLTIAYICLSWTCMKLPTCCWTSALCMYQH